MLKLSFIVICIAAASFIIDKALIAAHLPARVFDLLFFLLALYSVYFAALKLPRHHKRINTTFINKLSVIKYLALSLLLLLFILLGLLMIYIGFSDPLAFIESTRGSGYGYTLGALGVMFTLYSTLGLYLFIKVRSA